MSTQSQSKNQIQNQLSLKLIIDKKGKRILHAEADKKFVDFLFTILSLPVGTVTKLISTDGVVCPLCNLYRSVEAMNINYFQSNWNKDNLLKPSFPLTDQSQLDKLLQILDSLSLKPPTSYYSCGKCRTYFTATYGTLCSSCNITMGTTAAFVHGSSGGAITAPYVGGGYVKEMVTYMVMDDLTVKPMSSLGVLKGFNIKDVAQIDEKLVYLDAKQGVKLLRASLHSPNVLTDVFLENIDFA